MSNLKITKFGRYSKSSTYYSCINVESEQGAVITHVYNTRQKKILCDVDCPCFSKVTQLPPVNFCQECESAFWKYARRVVTKKQNDAKWQLCKQNDSPLPIEAGYQHPAIGFFAAPTGKKYHRSWCRSVTEFFCCISEKMAWETDYEPCPDCFIIRPSIEGSYFSPAIGYLAAPTGRKYHQPWCPSIKQSFRRVSEEMADMAWRTGYNPCSRCFPELQDVKNWGNFNRIFIASAKEVEILWFR